MSNVTALASTGISSPVALGRERVASIRWVSDRLPLLANPRKVKEVKARAKERAKDIGALKEEKETAEKGKGRKEKGKGKGKGKGKDKGHHYYDEWAIGDEYWGPRYVPAYSFYEGDAWSDYEWQDSQSEKGGGEPEVGAGDFGALELNNFFSEEIVEGGDALKYVQMIFDSGASCSAFPREVGEGYGIVKDEHAGYEYHGAGSENSAVTDEGRRSIQFFDENWAFKKQSHRVAKMRSPLVAASQTEHAGNIALLDADFSFIAPLS